MHTNYSRILPLAIFGTVVFILIHMMPLFSDQNELADEVDLPTVISKTSAENAAIRYIEEQLDTPVETSFVMFQTEKDFAGYLHKENMMLEYENRFMERYPIDYYLVQVNTVDHTTYLLRVDMETGEIIGFEKTFPIVPAQTEQAYAIAEGFMTSLGYDIQSFSLLTTDPDADRLIYESNTHTIGEASLQLHIAVEGEEVVMFIPKFSVPDTFTQWLSIQNKSADRMSLVSLLFSLFIGAAAIIAAIVYRKRIQFKHGIWLTFIYLITAAINNVLLYPGYKAQMPADVESGFVAMFTIAITQLFTFFTAVTVYFCLTSGDEMWRSFNKKLWYHWKEETFGSHIVHAMGHGYLLCLVLLGLQSVMFFIAEEQFHVWSVNDALFSSYNLLLPFLFPLLAWAAAISEEAIYRLFGVAFFKKIVRSTSIAILISSMFWAIGHTTYPIYPAYTRFIEVTILGLCFGWIMMRFGFLTAVYTHASFDSILMAFSLFGLGGATNHMFGLLYIASPAVAALILRQLHRFRHHFLPRST